ncbi:hypothetical protein M3Y97_00638600 [Aphelenchoides bicaudatus]|nr:hypothetical protein M3Y97_00638600 [Aphelenchoides bicaudatus]
MRCFREREFLRNSATSPSKKPDSHKSQPKLHTPEPQAEEPQSSKSQPCTPLAFKRSLKKQARLAEQDEEFEDMTNGDCYSSTEYVQFSAARNAYENVPVGTQSQLQRQSLLLNRSMDALNERIVHYTAGQMYADPRLLAHYDHQLPGCSRNSQVRGTLGRNWRVRTPVIMPREYVVDPGPIYSMKNGYASDRMDQNRRYRAKSLDNANRLTNTAPKKRANSRQPDDPNNRSALQSAKNFLRRLYNTSTLRLRRSGGRKMEVEDRRPDVNERPFLPYNIRYEVEDEEDEGAVYDSHVLSTPASSTSSAANHSPDEGIDIMEDSGASTGSARSAAIPRLYAQRPGSGLSSSTAASSSGLNSSTFSSNNMYGQDSNVYTVQSPRRQAPMLVERFRNWNELFEHLKKEMNDIRARDNQILQNLKKIEEEVQIVKQTAAI